ncbi:MAG: methylated-DNA--[protein]-cysteine S-methyltransferase [Panacagrimonas sp.]
MKTHSYLDSPLGPLLLLGSHGILTGLYMIEHKGGPRAEQLGTQDDAAFAAAREQLAAYFAGELREFDFAHTGKGTPFQQRVWKTLCEIPYGETISYGELARRIDQPTASRAVGLANGQNPISIIVPCHRVIGANGSLTGYGGGLERKRWLLAHEARQHGLLL